MASELVETIEHTVAVLEEGEAAQTVAASRLRAAAGLMLSRCVSLHLRSHSNPSTLTHPGGCRNGDVVAAKRQIRAAMMACSGAGEMLEEARHTLRLGLVMCAHGALLSGSC